MPRKIAVFVGALALAASALLTGAGIVSIPIALAASYNGPCGTVNNYHWYVQRVNQSFDKAVGQTTIGTYLACTGTTGSGQSMTIIATIEGSTISGDWNEAQCAVGQITGDGTHYWFTPYNDGRWYKFPAGPALNFGDHVQCAIWAFTSNSIDYWEYAITNITTNQTTYATSRRVGYGARVWWGHEIQYDYDLFGGEAGVGANFVNQPAYMYVGSSTLWAASGDVGQFSGGTQQTWMEDYVLYGPPESINAKGYMH